MIARLCANMCFVPELHHRSGCKLIELTTTVEEPGLAPHSSQWLFLASSFFLSTMHTQTYTFCLLHPEIEKEKKDVCNRTRRGSNPRCFDWKSTAQATAPYSHIGRHTHTYTRLGPCDLGTHCHEGHVVPH